jgi:hypothetical protein
MSDTTDSTVDIYSILDNVETLFSNHLIGDQYASSMLLLISDLVDNAEPTSESIADFVAGVSQDAVDGEDIPNSNRSYVLRTAETHVNGERNIDYGDPISDFRTTAEFWQTYLRRTVECRQSLSLKPHDVAAMMILLKMSRISWSPEVEDHWIDAAGYAACGYDCTERQ